MQGNSLLWGVIATIFAALISFASVPPVRVLAYKLKAIDIPTDERRMHKKPIPRLGGLAIYLGFIISALVFCEMTPLLVTVIIGGTAIVVLGVLDDIFRLKAIIKFIYQIGTAFIAVWQGVVVDQISLAGRTYVFADWVSVFITVFWIVGLTNAINLIDGLDGLSCGVSAISAFSLLLAAVMLGDSRTLPAIMLTAILLGSCIGFLPFNINPARIFMGDTGALFLGYTLSVVSVGGLVKTHALIAYVMPILIFALPLFDTAFAFLRRIIHGHSPFEPDRGHLHHRLIDMGLNQKQTVSILYSVSAIMGLSAVLFTSQWLWKAVVVVIIGLVAFIVNFALLSNPKTREKTGIGPQVATEAPKPGSEIEQRLENEANEKYTKK